jgi:hypothetical protein
MNFLYEQINFLSTTLDTKLSESNHSISRSMGDSLKNSSHIAEVSNKNIEAITKKLTEL